MQFASLQAALSFYENQSPETQVDTIAQIKNSTTKTTIGFPVRLKIPIIHVNAAVDKVGLTANGSMGVPLLPHDTAWYMFGPKPGENGSAVIAGHVNWWYGATGAFKNLKSLKPGDIITLQDDKGINTSFIVRRSHAYGVKDDDSDVFRSYDGKSHLNLITCDGTWDHAAQAYTKRLVVFTDKVID